MTVLLRADSVGKAYGSRKVLSSASLSVEPGAITLLVGKNGVGKSTLLEIMVGRTAPDHGTVRVDDETHTRARLHRLARKGVFYLPDRAILSPPFTLRQHLLAIASRFGTDEIGDVADLLGLSPLLDQLPGEFSGGERRRAEVALALVRSPRCLLADEPLRGVPPLDAERILAALRRLARNGCGVVLTGHEIPLVLPAADRVVWLTAGTTYPFASPAVAEEDPRFRREFLGMEKAAEPRSPNRPGPVPPSNYALQMAPVPSAAGDGTGIRSVQSKGTESEGVEGSRMKIDEQTLRDLEVFQAGDGGRSLFEILDYTRTAGGRNQLRQRFLNPPSHAAEIAATQLAIRFVMDHQELFGALPAEATLKEVDRYLRSGYTTTPAAGSFLRAAQSAWYGLRYPDLFDTVDRGVRITLEFLRSITNLAANVSRHGPPEALARILEPIAELLNAAEVRPLRLDEGTRRIARRDVLAYDRLLRDRFRSELRGIIDRVHELDALRSMAIATGAHDFVLPTLVAPDERSLRIDGVYHPLIVDSVRNGLDLPEGRGLVFLTGPNMAGKTTYLKACAVCVHLAHVGMGVPAASMELSPFDCLFSSINTMDNVRLGYSYFYSEVRRVKEAARLLGSGERVFAVFDEIFKGTNVRDAYDASRAVITALAGTRTSVIMVSSHLVELAEELKDLGTVHLQYFDAEIRDGEPVYDYTLKEGSSSQRLGMILLEQEEVLELLDRLRDSAE